MKNQLMLVYKWMGVNITVSAAHSCLVALKNPLLRFILSLQPSAGSGTWAINTQPLLGEVPHERARSPWFNICICTYTSTRCLFMRENIGILHILTVSNNTCWLWMCGCEFRVYLLVSSRRIPVSAVRTQGCTLSRILMVLQEWAGWSSSSFSSGHLEVEERAQQ